MLSGGRGDDVMVGGQGRDVVPYIDDLQACTIRSSDAGRVIVHRGDSALDILTQIGEIRTSEGDDILKIGGNDVFYDLNAGNDRAVVRGDGNRLQGSFGDEVFKVRGNDNTIHGEACDDRIDVWDNRNSVLDGSGNDTVIIKGNHKCIEMDCESDVARIEGDHNRVKLHSVAYGIRGVPDEVTITGDNTRVSSVGQDDHLILSDSAGTLIVRHYMYYHPNPLDRMIVDCSTAEGRVEMAKGGLTWTTAGGGSGEMTTAKTRIMGTDFDDRLVSAPLDFDPDFPNQRELQITLDGGKGADRMIGGEGSNLFIVDDLGDVVIERTAGGQAIDQLESSVDVTLGATWTC